MPTIEEVLLGNLTEEQRLAATDTSAEVLCLACAGSGKSRTLAYRIARLVATGVAPSSIVAFTFTEKAADSIKQRVAAALSAAGLSPTILGAMFVGTIHSYCQFVLGEMDAKYRQFDVLDENRLKLYLISRYGEINLAPLRDARLTAAGNRHPYFETIKQACHAWQTLNDEMLAIESVLEVDPIIGAALSRLDACMRRDQFIDFSMMIRLVVEGLRAGNAGARQAVSTIRHLMVDEYQDVNPLQEALIVELRRVVETLFVVGDDDQAIYAWRGADVNNILTFQQRFPQASQHTLPVNFRSTELIVKTADSFAAAELGATRYVKNPRANQTVAPNDYKVLWFDDRQGEAEWVASRIQSLLGAEYRELGGDGITWESRGLTPADFAILMRSTRTKEPSGVPRHTAFTSALVNRGINYSLEAGGSIFDRVQVAVLRSAFGLLRIQTPDRNSAQMFFDTQVQPAYPQADFNSFARVLTDWGRRIHRAPGGPRLRLYPQGLVHELLDALGISRSNFDPGTMQDIGMFSRILQDVESVYLSIDSAPRFSEILNFLENVAEEGYDTETSELLLRPDVVTVSTVHKMKGLEFPVVFVVDVEAQRFPKNRRSYSGWLPTQLIGPAIARGAYQSTRNEEIRLFYTAITRAERFIAITGSQTLPGGIRLAKRSSFAGRLSDPAISTSPEAFPVGLTQVPARRRIGEAVMPTSFSDIRYYLRCPKDYQLRKSFGFSPPVADLFGFGTTVHAAVCKLHELTREGAPTRQEAENIAREMFHVKHVPQSQNPDTNPGPYERAKEASARLVGHYAESYSTDFLRRRQVEVRFEIPVQKAVVSGSIDLMLREDQAGNVVDAAVVDFKAMEGGDEPTTNTDLEWAELSLQVQLYAKAARDVLGENARTGSLHLLKDNQRISIPVNDAAVAAAINNVEWAVDRIIADDFPMRPHPRKCASCDFRSLCPARAEQFRTETIPLPLHVPGTPNLRLVPAFKDFAQELPQ